MDDLHHCKNITKATEIPIYGIMAEKCKQWNRAEDEGKPTCVYSQMILNKVRRITQHIKDGVFKKKKQIAQWNQEPVLWDQQNG